MSINNQKKKKTITMKKVRNNFIDSIYSRIAEAMSAKQITTLDLAKLTGRQHSNLTNMLDERRDSRINTIAEIFHMLDLRIVFKDKKGNRISVNKDGLFDTATLGDKIKNMRVRNSLSIRGLAVRADVNPVTVRNFETGESQNVSISQLYLYLRALGFEISIEPIYINKKANAADSSKDTPKPVLKMGSVLDRDRHKLIHLTICLVKALMEYGAGYDDLMAVPVVEEDRELVKQAIQAISANDGYDAPKNAKVNPGISSHIAKLTMEVREIGYKVDKVGVSQQPVKKDSWIDKVKRFFIK